MAKRNIIKKSQQQTAQLDLLSEIDKQSYTPEQRNLMIKMLNHHNIKQRSKIFIRNNIFRA
jgi:hypothetical protein